MGKEFCESRAARHGIHAIPYPQIYTAQYKEMHNEYLFNKIGVNFGGGRSLQNFDCRRRCRVEAQPTPCIDDDSQNFVDSLPPPAEVDANLVRYAGLFYNTSL